MNIYKVNSGCLCGNGTTGIPSVASGSRRHARHLEVRGGGDSCEIFCGCDLFCDSFDVVALKVRLKLIRLRHFRYRFGQFQSSFETVQFFVFTVLRYFALSVIGLIPFSTVVTFDCSLQPTRCKLRFGTQGLTLLDVAEIANITRALLPIEEANGTGLFPLLLKLTDGHRPFSGFSCILVSKGRGQYGFVQQEPGRFYLRKHVCTVK